MTEVYFKKATYGYPVLKPIIFEMLEAILGDRIHPKSRVLVKPNFLSPAKPNKAILTHPLVVRAAVEYVLEKGGRPLVADSPCMGSFERMRKHFTQRPVVEPEVCKMCGECWQICPAKAITPYEEIIGFDYDRCIRCYCCIEVCPHGALLAVETFSGKLLRKITHLNE